MLVLWLTELPNRGTWVDAIAADNHRRSAGFYGLPSGRGKRGIEATEKGRTGEIDALLTEQSPWELLVLRLTKQPGETRTGETDALLTEQSPWDLLVLRLAKQPKETRYRGDRETENGGKRRTAHRTIAVGVAGSMAYQAARPRDWKTRNEEPGNRRIAHRAIAVKIAGFTAYQAARGNEISRGLGTETI